MRFTALAFLFYTGLTSFQAAARLPADLLQLVENSARGLVPDALSIPDDVVRLTVDIQQNTRGITTGFDGDYLVLALSRQQEGARTPHILLERAIYSEFGYAPTTTWVSVIIPKHIFTDLGPARIQERFHNVVLSLKEKNPVFQLSALTMDEQGLYNPVLSLSDEGVSNLNHVLVNGEESIAYSIPLTASDNAEDVADFIEQMMSLNLSVH